MRDLALALLVAATACGDDGPPTMQTGDGGTHDSSGPVVDAPPLIACTPVAGTTVSVRRIGQVAASAVLATSPPGDGRLFVLEQTGRIRIFENEQLLPAPFLDLSNTNLAGGVPPDERGLLGLAFHPNYGANRQFFVFYTTGSANIVARYYASATDPNRADPMGEIVMSIPDFAGNHNGGMIEFGPDGYLYIGTGDGGGGGDPRRNSQQLDGACRPNCEPLLGKILRIDVNTTAGVKNYGIPADNPFAGGGGEPEIYVIGLRNPWRWSFDRATGDMWVGDVGQNTDEELTVLRAGQIGGANLGWSMYEGTRCFGNYTCNPAGMVMPQVTRDRATGWRSVIGGEVYRGTCFPDLVGFYFMTDYAARPLVRAKLENDGTVTTVDLPRPTGNWPASPTSLHGDARGELFLTTTNGSVYQIEAGP